MDMAALAFMKLYASSAFSLFTFYLSLSAYMLVVA